MNYPSVTDNYYRIALAQPSTELGNLEKNLTEHLRIIEACQQNEVALLVFPELSLCGYNCQDLFFNYLPVDRYLNSLSKVTGQMLVMVGAPLISNNGRLYNCAVVIQHQRIVAVIPKSHLPCYGEYYEPRWFAAGGNIKKTTIAIADQQDIPFGVDLLLADSFLCGIEICEDLNALIPPSSYQALAGATLLVNLAASNDFAGKRQIRRRWVAHQSERCQAVYVYVSAGRGESVSDLVYRGDACVYNHGKELTMSVEDGYHHVDINFAKIVAMRNSVSNFKHQRSYHFRPLTVTFLPTVTQPKLVIDRCPFLPAQNKASIYYREVFDCTATALRQRMAHIKTSTVVIGLSGGVDSLLATLFAKYALDNQQILLVTMPAFAESKLAELSALVEALSLKLTVIDIKELCTTQLNIIDHQQDNDLVFENIQARQRTLLLLTIANQKNALMLGTSDLSEIALGFCTYGGDHLGMYNINCSIAKTLARQLVRWYGQTVETNCQELLNKVANQPSSPDLLTDKQETEEIIGPYELHDFFLYHTLQRLSFNETYRIALKTFADSYPIEEITKHFDTFRQRFIANQFKRNCAPDGPKVTAYSLSPRGDWRMPADLSVH